jgi:hypothetical protein
MQATVKIGAIIFFLLISWERGIAGSSGCTDTSILNRYESAFSRIEDLLQTNGSFQAAVFSVERAFYNDSLSEDGYANTITLLSTLVKNLVVPTRHFVYSKEDSLNFSLNFAIFSFIRDTVDIITDSTFLEHLPFRYDDKDPNGKVDWSNMFVRKLLITHKGNCHSLTYLYKMLADKLGARCWLALAPNHIYIRNYSQEIGWYNSELTSGIFPTDAWVAMTGYVSADAIRSGVYMDTLSNQQSISLCLLDLAKAYAFQTRRYDDYFIVKCCDLALRYHPVNPQALLLKAETLQKIYMRQKEKNLQEAQGTYTKMENTYISLVKLGYREMPEKAYMEWLTSGVKGKDKYSNKLIMHASQGK